MIRNENYINVEIIGNNITVYLPVMALQDQVYGV